MGTRQTFALIARRARARLRRRGALLAGVTVVAAGFGLGVAPLPAHAATDFYRIQHELSGLYLTADSATSGATVRLQAGSGNQRQQWKRESVGGVFTRYRLRAGNQMLCLDTQTDLPRSQQVVGAPFVVRPCDSSNSSQFGKLGVQSTAQRPLFRQVNLLSAMSIDVEARTAGSRVVQQPDDNTIAVTDQTLSEVFFTSV